MRKIAEIPQDTWLDWSRTLSQRLAEEKIEEEEEVKDLKVKHDQK